MKEQTGEFFNSAGQLLTDEQISECIKNKEPVFINKKGKMVSVCAAIKPNTGGRCRKPAGSGTGHVGTGRCKYHAGNAGPKLGNKNAVKHGLYCKLLKDQLEPEEQEYYEESIDNINKLEKINEEIIQCDLMIYKTMKKLKDFENKRAGLMASLLDGTITKVQSYNLEQLDEWIIKAEELLGKWSNSKVKYIQAKHAIELETILESDQAVKNIEHLANMINGGNTDGEEEE